MMSILVFDGRVGAVVFEGRADGTYMGSTSIWWTQGKYGEVYYEINLTEHNTT